MVTYAFGELGVTVVPQVVVGWLLYFYAPPPEEGKLTYVPIVSLGILSFLGRVSEAVSNPLVGHLSDTIRTPWGRRLPFIIFGTPILALSFIFMWFPLTRGPSLANTIYLGFMLVAFWFSYAAVVAPYLSLLPEITPYSQERIVLSSWMALFDVIGLLMATILVGAVVDAFPRGFRILGLHIGDGFKIVGLLFGVLTFFCFYSVAAMIRETRHSVRKEVPFSILRAGLECFRNPSFPPFVLAASCSAISIDMAVAVIPFLVKVVMRSTEAVAGLTQGLIVILAALFFPLVNRLAENYGKRRLYLGSFVGFAVLLSLLPTIGHWPILPPVGQGFVLFGLAAFPLSINLVLYRPIVADVIDHDERLTGYRREAMYNGMEGLITKSASALAVILITQLFYHFGNTVGNHLGIRLVGPVAGFMTFLGFLIFLRYPFNK